MVWPNRGAFGAIGGYGLNVLKLLQDSHRCCRYAPALGFNKAHKTIRQAQAPSPVFFIEAPGRPVFLLPSGYEGMARQGALPSSVQDPHLLAEMRKRLPARHPNIFEMSGLICGRLLPLRPQS